MTHRIWLTALLVWTLAGAASSPAPAQTSPESLAAARELVTTARMDEAMRGIFPVFMQQLKPAIAQGRPEVERDLETLMPLFVGMVNDRLPEFVELVAGIYASNFTAAELREVTGFYRTPTGQKFVQSQTVLAQQSMVAGQQFAQKLFGDMQERIKQELRKKGHAL
jgi:uncharacterized protein